LFAARNDVEGVRKVESGLGIVAMRRGDYQRAMDIYAGHIDFGGPGIDPRVTVVSALNYGVAKMWSCDLDGAEAVFRDNLKRCQELNFESGIAYCIEDLAMVALYRGDARGAIDGLRESIVWAERSGSQAFVADDRRGLGLALFASGDLDAAIDSLRDSITLAFRASDTPQLTSGLSAMGSVAMACQQSDTAQRLWRAAEAARSAIGLVEHPVETRIHAPWRAQIHDGAETPDLIPLPLEDAVELALESVHSPADLKVNT
jgi:tetratricopeptide (TPR) repeat protein